MERARSDGSHVTPVECIPRFERWYRQTGIDPPDNRPGETPRSRRRKAQCKIQNYKNILVAPVTTGLVPCGFPSCIIYNMNSNTDRVQLRGGKRERERETGECMYIARHGGRDGLAATLLGRLKYCSPMFADRARSIFRVRSRRKRDFLLICTTRSGRC